MSEWVSFFRVHGGPEDIYFDMAWNPEQPQIRVSFQSEVIFLNFHEVDHLTRWFQSWMDQQ